MFASRPTLSPELLASVRPVSLGLTRTLPLDEPWSEVLPGGGLRRGSLLEVVAPSGGGGLSVALTLLSGASARGHWAGVVGVDDPGVIAMADIGVDLRRVLFVPRPRGAWAEAVSDLLDGVDIVLVRPPSRASHGSARRVGDRVRERGVALVVLSEPGRTWPLPTDVTCEVTATTWRGEARLEQREMHVLVSGRGGLRPRTVALTLPNPHGRAVPA